MGVEGGLNIGQAQVRVVFLNKSPFSGQQKQEVSHYFTQDNFNGMSERNSIAPVPAPLNGFRLSENVLGFDNFLVDTEGTRLEDAVFKQEIQEGKEAKTVSVKYDSTAYVRYRQLFKEEGDKDPANKGKRQVSETERKFFTWQVTGNIFVQEGNPPPPNFNKRQSSSRPRNPFSRNKTPPDNTPEWTYVTVPRPGNDTKNIMLTPFMKKNPPDSTHPVHWGCKTAGGKNSGLAFNQGFEIAYYYNLKDPAIASEAIPMVPKYKFMTQGGQDITDLSLTGSVYLAIEFGGGSSNYNYMLLFRNETEPFLFQLGGKGQAREAVLLARFENFNASKLFDPNHKWFTLSIEPVVGSLIIRSNVFSQTPWIIAAPPTNPLFIGKGPIQVYSGNVQAGFAMRPIQYQPAGSFKTPETTFTIVSKGQEVQPVSSTALKGVGDIEQDRNYSSDGPEIHMVDSEKVNGNEIITFFRFKYGKSVENQSVKREINHNIIETTEEDRSSVNSLEIVTKTYVNLVTLIPGNVEQPSGFVVENGRSPYIFMIRTEIPGTTISDGEGEGRDISCDVMGVDLSWNATSYNEIKNTGTVRVLNIRNHSGTDYRQYTNRSVYMRIYAGWKGGVGDSQMRPIFTGQTLRADVETKAEREIVTFQVEDYMAALEGNKFILSPYYDGMAASLAVRDMMLSTGFPDGKILTGSTQISNANLDRDFGIPLANPLEGETRFRFKDGTSIKDGILRIAKLDFKVIYFDGIGNFHYETMPGGLFNNKNFGVKAEYWSSRVRVGSAPPENQAWNLVTFSRLINDVYNVVQVYSVEKRLLARLTAATSYKAGIFDPSAEGYLGYRKHFLFSEPALGSIDAVMRYLDNYRRRILIPPLTAKFETYGRSDINPLDIVTLDGQLLRVMNINTHIDKSENTFYQNIEGEWMFAAGSGKDQAPQLSSPSPGTIQNNNNAGQRSTF